VRSFDTRKCKKINEIAVVMITNLKMPHSTALIVYGKAN